MIPWVAGIVLTWVAFRALDALARQQSSSSLELGITTDLPARLRGARYVYRMANGQRVLIDAEALERTVFEDPAWDARRFDVYGLEVGGVLEVGSESLQRILVATGEGAGP